LSIERADVLRVLGAVHRPMGIRELLQQGGFRPGQQTELKRVLRDLVRAGEIEKEGKRFQKTGQQAVRHGPEPRPLRSRGKGERRPPAHRGGLERRPRERPGRRPEVDAEAARARRIAALRRRDDVVEGILHVHRDGYGFVHPLHADQQNVYLPVHEASRALDGDRVLVERVEGRGGRTSGILLEVEDRVRQRAVGVYRQEGRGAWVTPSDRTLPGDIRVPVTQIAQNGDLVKVVLGVGAKVLDPGAELTGEVTGSLGEPGQPSAEVLSIAYAQGFSDEFPYETMSEADSFALQVSPEDSVAQGRRDLRVLPLVTIDGADARDFDDAVYAEPTSEGWRLVVAIADVSHYVRPDSALDREAQHRGTSVYLPDRVLPMLPERLSNGICSLRPDEDRLCMVADLAIDTKGRLRSYEIYPGVMRSAARCTYDEVQDVLDGRSVPHRNVFRPHFENLMTLARTLGQMRRARGAIDFDLPEYKVILDEAGHPQRLEKRERKDSHRLIEECMLAANEAVAQHFRERGLPAVYRFHGPPDEEKLELFAGLARAHGFDVGASGQITSHQLNRFLEQLEGHPERRALNQLLLRSMMQAVYSAENVGHYGLGAEHYLHFTSPIRRYPDLLVHRLLKEHWSRDSRVPPRHEREEQEDRLEELAVQSSERERAAVAVEREVVAFYATLLMKDRIGETFAATVSSLADFGYFIQLDEAHVEGLVRGESLGLGFRFDPTVYALVWPDGRRVKVGDRLEVRLLSANVARRQLEFEPVALGREARIEEGHPRGKRGNARGIPNRASILEGPSRRRGSSGAGGGKRVHGSRGGGGVSGGAGKDGSRKAGGRRSGSGGGNSGGVRGRFSGGKKGKRAGTSRGGSRGSTRGKRRR
jgi:ribonuclease R